MHLFYIVIILLNTVKKNFPPSPGWCGSVDWVPVCEPKGCQFDSQSGHMLGLQARSTGGGVWQATTHWYFSPSFYLPSPVPKDKKIKSLEKLNHALAGVAQWIERGLQTKGLPVLFPVRPHAWVIGQVPSSGCVRGNHTLIFLSLSFSFLSPLSKNK